MKTTVENCARCGGRHEDIEFKWLTRPMAPGEVFWAWDQWALCPTNGDPIMQSVSFAFLTGPDALPCPEGTWARWLQQKVDADQREYFPELYK